MRLLLIFLLSITLNGSTFKEQDILPVDENGNYTFYEIVEAPGFDSSILINNAKDFLKTYINKKYRKKIVLNKKEGAVQAESHYLVYKKGSLGKHVDGAIYYSITIEARRNKYRYIITNFKYQPYQRNRYGRFVPDGRLKPLERSVGILSKWQWDDHKLYTKEKIETFISELKSSMTLTSYNNSGKNEVKIDDNW